MSVDVMREINKMRDKAEYHRIKRTNDLVKAIPFLLDKIRHKNPALSLAYNVIIEQLNKKNTLESNDIRMIEAIEVECLKILLVDRN